MRGLCCEFMNHGFTGEIKIKIPFGFVRAVAKAAEESGTSIEQVMFACMTSEYNINDAIARFDDGDLDWIHARQREAMVARDNQKAVIIAAEEAEALGTKMVQEARSAKASAGK